MTLTARLPQVHSNGHAPLFIKPVSGRSVATHRRTVSCLIPTLNEERNIAWVMQRIPACVDQVILIDGRSTDRTVAVARAIRPDLVLVNERGHGKGAALCAGFAAATEDYIVVLDADGSMDPAEIDYYVAALDDGYHFAKGSRYLRGGGSLDLTRIRSWGNRALVSAVNMMWRVSFTDLCYGFLAFRRDQLTELAPKAAGFEIEAELIVRALTARLRIAEVPSVELARHYGASNLHAWRDGNRILRTVVRERTVPRSRFVGALDNVAVRELMRRAAAEGRA
jgi:glycosyltransferase involved in cell wall biosynthesis